ncbi:hypothetical protein ACLETR_17490 [Escherichia coli]|uniref:hypothetical protein n=1 Tax=Escherichia coli TaxID=562 RepID=UPI001F291A97|nr:hypothetical protein [Escherichia coli]MCV8973767.1 hypothetical protein [Escherichia coli]MDF8411570.1 hypothetical protein [Escherichia coli]
MSIRTYAVNCNDAWLNTEGDDISGSYVKYKDHQEVVAALEAKCAALAAENAGLKAGHSYFSYGSEHNFEWHKTAEEAIESAEAAIDDYRGDACDGWSEEVDSICWGIIMQSSTKVGERPRNEDDCCDPVIDTICDYALLPNIETPATDAFMAEVRAQGVDAAIEAAKNLVAQEYECKDFKAAQSDCCMHPGSDLVGKVEMTEWLVDFAAQLRKGGNQ